MDIITAHRHGLLEQLEQEVAALGGRPHDFGQRAIVMHHLFDHSRGAHDWALAEARRSLEIAERLDRLRRHSARWTWSLRKRDAAASAIAKLAAALGDVSRARAITAYRAYRLSATHALRDVAADQLPATLLDLLGRCHSYRREDIALTADERLSLAAESEMLAASVVDQAQQVAAWSAISAAGLSRVAQRLLGERALGKIASQCERKGPDRLERIVRHHPSLPPAFKANPAQHFYAVQHSLAQKQRNEWRNAADFESELVELAA